MISIGQITPKDSLHQWVEAINAACWDRDNELPIFSVEHLAAFVSDDKRVFLVGSESAAGETHVLGLASAQIMFKPHSSKMALYVDEVDVCTDHRRRGVGRLLMERLRSIAKARRCREIWLATEHNNGAALGLYQSLGPDEVIDARVFTFETVDS